MVNANWSYSPNGEIPEGMSLPDGVFRIGMKVEYDGSAYSGWQRQQNSKSVQESLEKVLSKIANEPIKVVCAGRTDTGVHATSQFIHFDTRAERPARKWQLGCNSALPDDISICWVGLMSPQFHARFSARSRTYRYLMYAKKHNPAILRSGLTWVREPLDVVRMDKAAQYLLGEHDLSSFRASGCGAYSPVRTVLHAKVTKVADFIVLEIQANAFLQHMVRNIVGLLLKIGSSDLEPEYLRSILEAKDRTQSAPTAKPNGLYFVDVEYPPKFAIPTEGRGPSFLSAALVSDDSNISTANTSNES